MQAQFRARVVVLTVYALVLIVAPHAIAQTSPQATMQQEVTKQQVLVTDGSRKLIGASKEMREAVKMLETKKGYSKARQLVAKADKTMAEGEQVLAEAQRIDTKLLTNTRRSAEVSKKMILGAKLMRSGIAAIMKDKIALSRAQKVMREGQGMLKRSQELLTTAQL